jgi:hypothetical protein
VSVRDQIISLAASRFDNTEVFVCEKEIEPMKSLITAICLSFMVQVAFAQSPYAGMQTRSIKALSDQQIADLKSGRGMGLAMAAELNGYPGPIHVLELSDKLGLSSEQKSRIEDLFQSMRAEAVPLGEKLLAQEAALDQQFASHSITAEGLMLRRRRSAQRRPNSGTLILSIIWRLPKSSQPSRCNTTPC